MGSCGSLEFSALCASSERHLPRGNTLTALTCRPRPHDSACDKTYSEPGRSIGSHALGMPREAQKLAMSLPNLSTGHFELVIALLLTYIKGNSAIYFYLKWASTTLRRFMEHVPLGNKCCVSGWENVE